MFQRACSPLCCTNSPPYNTVCIGELRIPTAVSFENKMSSRSRLMLDLDFSTVWGFLCCFVVSICCRALCTDALSYHHELWLLNCGLIPLQMAPFPPLGQKMMRPRFPEKLPEKVVHNASAHLKWAQTGRRCVWLFACLHLLMQQQTAFIDNGLRGFSSPCCLMIQRSAPINISFCFVCLCVVSFPLFLLSLKSSTPLWDRSFLYAVILLLCGWFKWASLCKYTLAAWWIQAVHLHLRWQM